MKRAFTIVALGAALLLAGCATTLIPYQRTAAVKNIGLVTPNMPDRATAIVAAKPGVALGAVGILLDAVVAPDHSSELTELLERSGFAARDTFQKAITDKLNAEGYTVTPVPSVREPNAYLDKYPPSPGVDAYLDVSFRYYGFVALTSLRPYRPSLVVRARLADARTGAILMQTFIAKNGADIPPNAVKIPLVDEERFDDFAALSAHSNDAVRELREAIEQSADTIAKLIQ